MTVSSHEGGWNPASNVNFEIKVGKDHVDVEKACNMLSKTYWGHRRPLDKLKVAVDNSICYSAHVKDGLDQKMVGFGRIITDRSTFAYFTDVIVESDYQKCGIGSAIVQAMRDNPEIDGCYKSLSSLEHDEFYERAGFKTDDSFRSQV